jgi:DedD protein
MKQRIIGGIVVFVAVSTVMVLIFDGEGGYTPAIAKRIPERPHVDTIDPPIQVIPQIRGGSVAVPELRSLLNTESDPSVETLLEEPSAIIAIEDISESPSLGADGLPEGFVIQMGVFSNFDNAERFRSQLISDGYKAYSRKSMSGNVDRITVFVGPWLDRNRVEGFREELNQKYGVLGLVKLYELENL